MSSNVQLTGPLLAHDVAGGPGNSGTYQVQSGGHFVQKLVDPHLDPAEDSDGKYFDIIGFDPRAVGKTTPHPTCFPDPSAENKILPFAVEAAWVTGRWESLGKFTGRFQEDVAQDFNMSIASLLDSLYHRSGPDGHCGLGDLEDI